MQENHSVLDRLTEQDPNALRYLLRNSATGKTEKAVFQPLTIHDTDEISGHQWSNAVFFEVWKAWIGNESVLKIVYLNNPDSRIQGLLHLGRVLRPGGA